MRLTMSFQEFQTRLDVILSTAAGTGYGIYQAIETNNIGSSFISFMIDTAIHLTQGAIVGIGTYLAVHYFKKIFHKTKKQSH